MRPFTRQASATLDRIESKLSPLSARSPACETAASAFPRACGRTLSPTLATAQAARSSALVAGFSFLNSVLVCMVQIFALFSLSTLHNKVAR